MFNQAGPCRNLIEWFLDKLQRWFVVQAVFWTHLERPDLFGWQPASAGLAVLRGANHRDGVCIQALLCATLWWLVFSSKVGEDRRESVWVTLRDRLLLHLWQQNCFFGGGCVGGRKCTFDSLSLFLSLPHLLSPTFFFLPFLSPSSVYFFSAQEREKETVVLYGNVHLLLVVLGQGQKAIQIVGQGWRQRRAFVNGYSHQLAR